MMNYFVYQRLPCNKIHVCMSILNQVNGNSVVFLNEGCTSIPS